ncbi:MAG: hypothetical protein ACYCT9_06070 [Leptospirillum sp.]
MTKSSASSPNGPLEMTTACLSRDGSFRSLPTDTGSIYPFEKPELPKTKKAPRTKPPSSGNRPVEALV